MDLETTKKGSKRRDSEDEYEIKFSGQSRSRLLGAMNEYDLDRVKRGDTFEIVSGPSKDVSKVREKAKELLEEIEKNKRPPSQRVTLVSSYRVVVADKSTLEDKSVFKDREDTSFVEDDPTGFGPGTLTRTGSMVSVGTFSVMNSSFALLIPTDEAYVERTNSQKAKKPKTLSKVTIRAKDTGWVQFDRVPTKKRKQPAKNTAMEGAAAHVYAQLKGDSKIHVLSAGWEWLHLLGVQLGGENAAANLVAGTFPANSAMIPVENGIKTALKKGKRGIKYRVTATLYGETHIGEDIVQSVEYGGKGPINFPLSGTLKAYRREEFAGFEFSVVYQRIAEYLDLRVDEIPEDPGEDDVEDVED